MVARPLAAAMIAVALVTPARAADVPAKGPDPLIRSYVFNPAKSWLLTSTNLEPVLVVLDPGEQVRGVLGTRVTLDSNEARAIEGGAWFIAQKSGTGQAQPTPAEGEDTRVAAEGRAGAADRSKRAGVDISDEISFQPTRYMEPTLVRVMTLAADGTPRQHVFVLATREGPSLGKPDPEFYAMVRVIYPRVPTPEELAVARAARAAAQQAATVRLAASRLEQDRYTIQTNKDYRASDGARSPGACMALGVGPGAAPPRVEVSDDGATTTLFFPTGRPTPSLYAKTLAGEPMSLTPAVETVAGGTRATLPSTYRDLFLLLENNVCGLLNRGHGAGPRQPGGGTGTVSPYVVRAPRVAPGYGVGG